MFFADVSAQNTYTLWVVVLHSACAAQSFEVVAPCILQPFEVVGWYKIGDVQRVLARQRAALHAYFYERFVVFVVPLPSYPLVAFAECQRSLARFVMSPVVAPGKLNVLAVHLNVICNPSVESFGCAYELPHDIARCGVKRMLNLNFLLVHAIF